MNGTIVNFIDNSGNDSIMIRFNRIVKKHELNEIKIELKKRIAECIENEEYLSLDDKDVLTNVLNQQSKKYNFKWKIIQIADYNIEF